MTIIITNEIRIISATCCSFVLLAEFLVAELLTATILLLTYFRLTNCHVTLFRPETIGARYFASNNDHLSKDIKPS